MYRELVKAFGIRFIIKVSGTAGRFGIIPLLLNIGSGIGLLAIVSQPSPHHNHHHHHHHHYQQQQQHRVVSLGGVILT